MVENGCVKGRGKGRENRKGGRRREKGGREKEKWRRQKRRREVNLSPPIK